MQSLDSLCTCKLVEEEYMCVHVCVFWTEIQRYIQTRKFSFDLNLVLECPVIFVCASHPIIYPSFLFQCFVGEQLSWLQSIYVNTDVIFYLLALCRRQSSLISSLMQDGATVLLWYLIGFNGLTFISQHNRLGLKEAHVESNLHQITSLMSAQSLSFSICEINRALLLQHTYLGYVIISYDNFRYPEKALLSMQIIKCSGGCLFLIGPLSPSYKSPINFVLLSF